MGDCSGLPSPISLLSPGAASQFYEMAAKDKVCGINLVVALNDLDLGAWIDRPGDVACYICMDLVQKWNDTASWGNSALDMPIWSEDLGAA